MKTARRARSEAVGDGKFHERIRLLRIQQGYTQAEVAEVAEISVRTYRDWEYAKSEPRMGEPLRAVAHAFRRSPGWLLTGKEDI